jgi:2-keto-4-pentenoate hydratase/2-oxohepta-3-ene-1,7-dioic acid hydratase in catechol pathway
MRLVSYQSDHGPRVAALEDGTLVDLNQTDPSLPSCPKALLALGPAGIERAALAVAGGTRLAANSVRLLPAIPNPEKIIAVGRNYAEHAKETGATPSEEPILFCKFPTAIAADSQPILLPRESQEVDYEAELVVVIGIGGRRIPRHRALEHVAAYCCGVDVSARDWQLRKPGGQWLLGKSFDSFAPIGPWLTTADEVPNPNNLTIQLRLNGQVMQDSSTSNFIFPIEELVSYASRVCTLRPGDLIFTGTPPGVGFARKPPVFLKPGDQVEVAIQGLGVLRNPVAAEQELTAMD